MFLLTQDWPSYLQWSNSKIIEFVNIFLCFSKTWYLVTIIPTINKVRELSTGVSKAKIGLKLVKKPIHSYLWFQNYYICQRAFSAFLTWHTWPKVIFGKNVVTELTTRISETKTNPKFAKILQHFLIFLSNC